MVLGGPTLVITRLYLLSFKSLRTPVWHKQKKLGGKENALQCEFRIAAALSINHKFSVGLNQKVDCFFIIIERHVTAAILTK